MSMRITGGMMTKSVLNNLNTNLARMDKYSRQLAAEKRITKLSDDPVGVITCMQARAKMKKIEQYQDNVSNARTWIQGAETAMSDINKLLANAYETCIDMGTDGKTAEDKKAGAVYIKELMNHLVQTANASVGEQYVFGGFNTGKQPFEVDSNGKLLYNGKEMLSSTPNLVTGVPADSPVIEANQIIEFEIGYGLTTEVSFTGVALMGVDDKNLYTVLEGLYNDLMNDESAEKIGENISKLQGAQSDVLSMMAELGGRDNRMKMIESRYEQEYLNYASRLSEVEDVDLTEAALNLSTAKAVYDAALQVGANIIQPTLMDYLR